MKTRRPITFTLLTIFSAFALSGCFNFFEEEPTDDGLQPGNSSSYETDQFSISIPSDWEVIESNDFTSEVPPETVVVFRNNVKNETFTANVNIVERGLQEPVSATEYANLVNNRQKSGLVDYRELSKETINIPLGDSQIETYLTVFEARKATNENMIRYYQTYGVRENAAFIVTGAVSTQETETTSQTVENIVRSFRLQ